MSSPGSSPGWGHCCVLGQCLSPSTQVYKWVLVNCWGNLTNCGGLICYGLASHPVGSRNTPCRFMLQKLGSAVMSHLAPSLGGGGTRYILGWGCAVRPLFKTNITDFPTLFKTEFRFLIPCLRHLKLRLQEVVWLSCCAISGNLMCLVSMPKSTEVNIN